MEQNNRLLPLVESKPAAFQVVHDLNNANMNFDREGPSHNTRSWMKSADTMAMLRDWPGTLKTETAKLHMKGAGCF